MGKRLIGFVTLIELENNYSDNVIVTVASERGIVEIGEGDK
ncbi:MAG TPA: hypothetical protein VE244_10780 [Nitrososphaeraceae archaeon]|nr:hypothetical protein [Nitrososphaeraceae archaeon]